MKFSDFLNESGDQTFNYMMLGRLQNDVKYFLGSGGASESNLWGLNIEDHIKEMKKQYNLLKDKPDWISMDDIEQYEKDMKKAKKEKGD